MVQSLNWRILFQEQVKFLKPGFHIVFMGLCRSLWVAEGRTVLGKTVKDRERPNRNTIERSAKTVSDP